MSEMFNEIPSVLLRTTIFLTVSSLIVRGIMWAVQPRSPLVHRLAWSFVLLQGLFVAQWSFNIPWYEAVGGSRADPARHDFELIGALPDFSDSSDRVAVETHHNPAALVVPSGTAASGPRTGFSFTQILSGIWFAGNADCLELPSGQLPSLSTTRENSTRSARRMAETVETSA